MPTTSEIHGHEVIRMVHGANPPLTRPQLVEMALRRFGEGARFHTCSLEGLTLAQLLEFLAAHGKVVEHDGRMVADIGEMCGGDSAHHETH